MSDPVEPDPLLAAILAPLRDLLRRYDAAASVIARVSAGIESILSGFEPSALPASARPVPVRPPPVASVPAPSLAPARSAIVDAIRTFTEGLAALPGVQSVSPAGEAGTGPSYVVELEPPVPGD